MTLARTAMFRFLIFLCVAVEIVLSRRHHLIKRQAPLYDFNLWKDGIINYRFVDDFSPEEVSMIEKAMREWEVHTCIRFNYTGGEEVLPLVNIGSHDEGCFATVTGSPLYEFHVYPPVESEHQKSYVNLEEGCMDHRIILHELGHVIGLMHEHTRRDRDKHIIVEIDNILPDLRDQFEIPMVQRTYGTPYSLYSVMHYPKYAFGKTDDHITLEAKDSRLTDIIGMIPHLSFRDVQLVNRMYKCAAHCPRRKSCAEEAIRGPNCRCWCPSLEFTALDCKTGAAIDKTRPKLDGGVLKTLKTGEKFFRSENDLVPWHRAREHCQQMNGELVSVDSPEVDKMLMKINEDIVDTPTANRMFWTGANDIEKTGTFRWVNGNFANLSHLNWAMGLPDNESKKEDCVFVTTSEDGNLYQDTSCGWPMNYICSLPQDGCHDLSGTCWYFEGIGRCHKDPRMMHFCRQSCEFCKISSDPDIP